MFRKNDQHQQMPMFSSINSLPEKQLKRLEESWAGTSYHEFFAPMDEEIFAVLYSDKPSRPNIPVNVLAGLETLKSGFGWDDNIRETTRLQLLVEVLQRVHRMLEESDQQRAPFTSGREGGFELLNYTYNEAHHGKDYCLPQHIHQ